MATTEADLRPAFPRLSPAVPAAAQPARFLCGCRDCAVSREEWMLQGGYTEGGRLTAPEAQTRCRPAGLVPGVGLQTANG